jgi:hypothetical protein
LHEAAEKGRRAILDFQETSTPPLLGELCTAAECFHNMQQQLEKIECGTPEEKSAAEACIIKTKESANKQLELFRSRGPDVAWASDLCGKWGHRVENLERRLHHAWVTETIGGLFSGSVICMGKMSRKEPSGSISEVPKSSFLWCVGDFSTVCGSIWDVGSSREWAKGHKGKPPAGGAGGGEGGGGVNKAH